MLDRRRMAINRAWWDESVAHHVASASYDVPSFLRGRSSLRSLEIQALGSVRSKALLHLQCHFGMDTLSWARRGALVTGVDFSPRAIRAARRLAREAKIPATFLRANVYDLPASLDQRFDIVYTGKGAIGWLPDAIGWAAAVARVLKPGGIFFLLEDHPIAEVFNNDGAATRFEPRFPYFGGRPVRDESNGTYASSATMRHHVTYGWIHPVSEMLTALTSHGLEIGSVREYPFTFWRRFPFLTKDARGWWGSPTEKSMIPLMWSVQARRKS
ncbi:MAG: class I SAM-dependent methyltransferase [Thermoplasmata archaeon]|nr:class I SAM-dependent methyltransferase [Thermoplasmata archaeon]